MATYKRPKLTKIRSEISLEAIRLAKDSDDVLYRKYKKFRNLMLKYRERIMKKYTPKAKQKVYSK